MAKIERSNYAIMDHNTPNSLINYNIHAFTDEHTYRQHKNDQCPIMI